MKKTDKINCDTAEKYKNRKRDMLCSFVFWFSVYRTQ